MEFTFLSFPGRFAKRIFVLFILCALLPITSLAVITWRQVTERLEEESFRQLRHASKNAGMAIVDALISLQNNMESLLPPGTEFAAVGDGAGSRFRKRLRGQFTAVTFYPPEAPEIRWFGERCPPPPVWATEWQKTARPVLYVDPGVSGRDRYFLAVPARNRPAQGFVVAEIDLSYLRNAAAAGLPSSTYIHVFGPRGLAWQSGLAMPEAAVNRFRHEKRERPAGRLEWTTQDEIYLASFWSVFLKGILQADDWLVVVSQSKNEAFYAIDRFTKTYATILLLTVLTVFLLASVQIRRRLLPLTELNAVTDRVRKGDFSVRASVKSNDEFGELSESINRMAAGLSDREEALEEAQAALVQSEKMAALGQLGAGIAHEIKNPLAGILLAAEFSRMKVDDTSPAVEHLETIEREANRCKEIIDHLLTFARQEPVTFGSVRINDVIENTVRIMSHQIALDKIKLSQTLASGLPTVRGNANHLQQVMMNLLGNAQQALEGTPGHIAITSVLNAEGWVEISVADTGPGIPDDQQKRVFEPFFTTKRPGRGTGLGLSVSYGIVQKHQGTIAVRSGADGGTVFTVALPPETESRNEGMNPA